MSRLAANEDTYELQSYKPVHFGFVKTSQSALLGRYEYRSFHKLMRHTVSARPSTDESSYLQQLALASLFVPYKLQHGKSGRFFRESPTPVHYLLLFADLEGTSSKQAALGWSNVHRGESKELDAIVHRINTYQEPRFGPQKGDKPGAQQQK